MTALFRKKTFLDRARDALGRPRKKHRTTAVRSGLVTLGSVAAVTAASAAVSAVRARMAPGGGDGSR